MGEACLPRLVSSQRTGSSSHSRPTHLPPAPRPTASTSLLSASSILAIASASLRPTGMASSASSSSASSSRCLPLTFSSSPAVRAPSISHSSEIANYLETVFCPAVEPTSDEYSNKEEARRYLEVLTNRVSPGARLLPFGSMANGFALRNSDMDLCCFAGTDAPQRSAAELVELLGALIGQETDYQVKMLPRARIPIIKLSMPPSAAMPFGMACDIGFENRLALENTRLLLTYAKIDDRLRTMVLFLKVWTKRRQINNPYRGTLSSYGYVLLVIYFLEHIKKPAVLPNLQRLHSMSSTVEALEYNGHDISFFDDLDALKSVWSTSNADSSGQLLIDFFRFYAKEFSYATQVISIRSEHGLISKEVKGWQNEPDFGPDHIVRDQYKLCIEDPFQLDYNVARTVTRDGLYTIRGEFIRACGIFSSRSHDRVSTMINEICDEREDYIAHHPSPFVHSPRRRSAPSPRLASSTLSHVLEPAAMSNFRIWAALNGVDDGGSGTRSSTASLSSNTSRKTSAAQVSNDTSASPSATTPLDLNSTSKLLRPPSSHIPAIIASSLPRQHSHSYQSNFSQHQYQQSHQYQHQHQHQHQPSPHFRPDQSHPRPHSPFPMSQSYPSSTVHSPPRAASSAIERRTSWDGTRSSETVPARGSGGGGGAGGGGYDLHRFFQNPSHDQHSSSQDAELAPPSSNGFQEITFPVVDRSSDASSSFLSENPTAETARVGHQNDYAEQIDLSSHPSTPRIDDRHSQLSMPLSQQPRQEFNHPHNALLFASSPAPPLRTSSLIPRSHHISNCQSSSPIFPEAARQAIILANSITFGNFESTIPHPSLSKPHSTSFRSRSQVPPTSPISSTLSGVGSLALIMHDVVFGSIRKIGDDQAGQETNGSSSFNSVDISRPVADEDQYDSLRFEIRRRGRSVPMRLGLDGRGIATVKFGEVETEFFVPRSEVAGKMTRETSISTETGVGAESGDGDGDGKSESHPSIINDSTSISNFRDTAVPLSLNSPHSTSPLPFPEDNSSALSTTVSMAPVKVVSIASSLPSSSWINGTAASSATPALGSATPKVALSWASALKSGTPSSPVEPSISTAPVMSSVRADTASKKLKNSSGAGTKSVMLRRSRAVMLRVVESADDNDASL